MALVTFIMYNHQHYFPNPSWPKQKLCRYTVTALFPPLHLLNPKELKRELKIDTCTPMFIAASLTVAKKWQLQIYLLSINLPVLHVLHMWSHAVFALLCLVISLGLMLSRFICVVAYCRTSFFMVE